MSFFQHKLWGHRFSTYAKFSEKLIFLTPDTHMCAYKGVRYVKFFGNILMTPLLLFTFLQTINWTRTKISPFGTNFK